MFRIHPNLRRAAGVSVAASLLVACFAFTASANEAGSVLGSSVRLRSEPSTDSEVLEVLDEGDALEILDSSDEDWYQVSYTDTDGTLYTGYVSRALVSTGVTQTATITGDVALKSEPSTEAEVLAQLSDGEVVVILDDSDASWIQVSYAAEDQRLTGYISSDSLYVNPLATGVTTCASAILRAEADSASEILSILDAGVSLDILGSSNGWYQVTDGTLTGYVEQQLLSTENDTDYIGYGTVTASSLYLRSQPNTDSEVLAELPSGATFQITADDTEGWYTIVFNGQSGYVSADYVSFSETISSGYVQAIVQPLILRAGAGTVFAELASIPEGTVLPVSGSYDGWFRVSYDGYVGYVSGAYVSSTTESGYQNYPSFALITATSLTLREQPTAASSGVATIPGNTVVAVSAKLGDWYLITYNGTEGYIDSSYTTVSDGPATSTAVSTDASNRTSLSAGASSNYEGGSTVSGSTGSAVADYAIQFLGNPYVWGGTSLTNGCDCSGFVMQVYANFGVSLPHSSSAIRSYGQSVSLEDIQPGDIVCYNHHVGIYVGDGTIISALGANYGITYSSVTYKSIITIRRIFN